MVADAPVSSPLREPGQVVDADYRRRGQLRYAAENREIVGRNLPYYNNRPLYCKQNTEGAVLAGDRPHVRLIAKPFVHGSWAARWERGGVAVWLHDFAEVESRYRCGRMAWLCSDPRFPGLRLELTVAPMVEVAGFALRVRALASTPGDRLAWTYGGAHREEDPRWKWDPVMQGNPDIVRAGDPRRALLRDGFTPDFCRGNRVEASGCSFRLAASSDASHAAIGHASSGATLRVGDAGAVEEAGGWSAPPAERPIVLGATEGGPGFPDWFLAVEVVDLGAPPERAAGTDPARAYALAIAYLATVERARSTSPDARLDAAVTAVCHAVDGNCERDPYIFRHGCMAFSCRFVGWRVICGATALGWHERVAGNARYTIGLQKTADPERTAAQASEERLLVHEGRGSRFYGKGSLDRDFPMYDVQTQFFDQTINGWRAAADPALERLLRPALELHCEWMKACFDPDDDGLYESYINTLPTDSVWYNGGGSAEQSAYAFTAHRAARDLARRAGNQAAAGRHEAQAQKIQKAMRDLLWVPARGHFGLYREQGGLGRVHDDAWTYSVFLPIDAGLTTPDEALQSLYYTEWGLERVPLPFGGELCQLSNWVPWKWSVRDFFGGDLCHLALAHFQTGLGDEGYALLQGHVLESAFASAVPGGFSHIGAATDFGDNVHMVARTIVEGLYGYVPDYPNGRVLIRPALPARWPAASIETPDFSLRYRQEAGGDYYRLTLAKAAVVQFRLPLRAAKAGVVRLNDREVRPRLTAGFGHTWLEVEAPKSDLIELFVELTGRDAGSSPRMIAGEVGAPVALEVPATGAVEWHDLHGTVVSAPSTGAVLAGRLAAKPGHHLVIARYLHGELPRDQVFKLEVTDAEATRRHRARTPREAAPDSAWSCVDLSATVNGDVRTIFQQRYLTPRPATCSVRLGVDGYSAWTFPYWNLPPPAIDLRHVPGLLDGQGRILTPQRVPFAAWGEDRNIAFTSRWDNWPRSVTVTVQRAAETVWLLVCGSTFPMQTRIANAELQFHYADGEVERLELVPPLNFWMLSTWGGCDYSYEHDAFCLPELPPPQVQLGKDCRAMVLSWKLRPGVPLASVTLATLSQDVVIGLMGLTLENPVPLTST